MQEKQFIADLFEQIVAIANNQFGKGISWAKDGDKKSILTQTDLEIGVMAIDAIRKKFPNDNIIDEEHGIIDNGGERTWVIDPIDGTSNFAAGVPTYGSIIGLLESGEPIAGGFALPSLGEIYLAAKGEGATRNGENVHVNLDGDLSNLLVAFGMHPKNKKDAEVLSLITKDLLSQALNIRSSASAFDMGMVASGHYGAFISSRGRIWDCVGAHIVLEEAGGQFVHFDGTKIDYSSPLDKVGFQFSYAMGGESAIKQITSIVSKYFKDLA